MREHRFLVHEFYLICSIGPININIKYNKLIWLILFTYENQCFDFMRNMVDRYQLNVIK